MSRQPDIRRSPAAETEDYPGVVVHDGRVTGSMTTGHTRLPLWCFITTAITEGWAAVEDNWSPSKYDWDANRTAVFLYYLMEQRGEFGRLVSILADVERQEQERFEKALEVSGEMEGWPPAWWNIPELRDRVKVQLQHCLEAINRIELDERSS